MKKTLLILGIRGIPGRHGGFETFAHHFSPWLVQNDWDVTVYCQHSTNETDAPADGHIDYWNGVRRVHLSVPGEGTLSTMIFDLRCALHASKSGGPALILGYNTAIFNVLQRIFGQIVLMNMDGIEWQRAKWGPLAKLWLRMNEYVGARISNILIADHPKIAEHLERHNKKAIVIPYGAPSITAASTAPLATFQTVPDGYFVTICRIEPENSLLEIVSAFSTKRRGYRLIILGRLDKSIPYHMQVARAASDEVIFAGAIYDSEIVSSLRYHSRAYIHGHQVGGTNPSLVEAMGSGSAIIAHDNQFNRWVAGEKQFYFRDQFSLETLLDQACDVDHAPLASARIASMMRHQQHFTYDVVHSAYANTLTDAIQIK